MVDKAFFVRDSGNGLRVLLDGLLAVADDTHALEEVVHAERAEEATRAVRRQHMVGARKVVAHRFRGPRADKHGTRILDLGRHGFGFTSHHFQVFRSDAVRNFHAVEPVLTSVLEQSLSFESID